MFCSQLTSTSFYSVDVTIFPHFLLYLDLIWGDLVFIGTSYNITLVILPAELLSSIGASSSFRAHLKDHFVGYHKHYVVTKLLGDGLPFLLSEQYELCRARLNSLVTTLLGDGLPFYFLSFDYVCWLKPTILYCIKLDKLNWLFFIISNVVNITV